MGANGTFNILLIAEVEQLARVDDVQALHIHARRAIVRGAQQPDLPVESVDDVDWFRHVAHEHGRHRQSSRGRNAHAYILVDYRSRVAVGVWMAGLENMGGWRGSFRFKELALVAHDEQLVLCASQGHAFGGLRGERCPGYVRNTPAQRFIRQRGEASGLGQGLARWQQGE